MKKNCTLLYSLRTIDKYSFLNKYIRKTRIEKNFMNLLAINEQIHSSMQFVYEMKVDLFKKVSYIERKQYYNENISKM